MKINQRRLAPVNYAYSVGGAATELLKILMALLHSPHGFVRVNASTSILVG